MDDCRRGQRGVPLPNPHAARIAGVRGVVIAGKCTDQQPIAIDPGGAILVGFEGEPIFDERFGDQIEFAKLRGVLTAI